MKGSIRFTEVSKIFRWRGPRTRRETLKSAFFHRRSRRRGTASAEHIALEAIDLEIAPGEAVRGRPVLDVIPNSLLPQVIRTGRPIPVDLMQFEDRWFVVMRMPMKDADGRVTGAVGFVLYDRLDFLKPLVSKFTALQTSLGTLWEWDGWSWTLRPEFDPEGDGGPLHIVYAAAAAYDVARQRAILYGGFFMAGFSADTWE